MPQTKSLVLDDTNGIRSRVVSRGYGIQGGIL